MIGYDKLRQFGRGVMEVLEMGGSCVRDLEGEALRDGEHLGMRWYPYRSISSQRLWQGLQVEIWDSLPGCRELSSAVYLIFKGDWWSRDVQGTYRSLFDTFDSMSVFRLYSGEPFLWNWSPCDLRKELESMWVDVESVETAGDPETSGALEGGSVDIDPLKETWDEVANNTDALEQVVVVPKEAYEGVASVNTESAELMSAEATDVEESEVTLEESDPVKRVIKINTAKKESKPKRVAMKKRSDKRSKK